MKLNRTMEYLFFFEGRVRTRESEISGLAFILFFCFVNLEIRVR